MGNALSINGLIACFSRLEQLRVVKIQSQNFHTASRKLRLENASLRIKVKIKTKCFILSSSPWTLRRHGGTNWSIPCSTSNTQIPHCQSPFLIDGWLWTASILRFLHSALSTFDQVLGLSNPQTDNNYYLVQVDCQFCNEVSTTYLIITKQLSKRNKFNFEFGSDDDRSKGNRITRDRR